MHRNDWLPVATVQPLGDWTSTPLAMCFGKVADVRPWLDLPYETRVRIGESHQRALNGYGRAFLRFEPRWDEEQGKFVDWVHVTVPCAFVKGHPGQCGSELPDIFLPDGRVKPQIERLLRNRRKPHGPLDPAPDSGPAGAGAAGDV